MGLAAKRQDETEARIAGLAMPSGAAWAETARKEALARFRAMGLPDRRDEYWRFTRPDSLNQATAPEAAIFDPQEAPTYDQIDRLKIVFRDGVFDPEASDENALVKVKT